MPEHFQDSKLVSLAQAGDNSRYYYACNSLNIKPDPLFKDAYDMGAAQAIEEEIDNELIFANFILETAKKYGNNRKKFLQDQFPKFRKKTNPDPKGLKYNQDITNYSKEKIFGLYNGVIKSYQKVLDTPRSELLARKSKEFLRLTQN